MEKLDVIEKILKKYQYELKGHYDDCTYPVQCFLEDAPIMYESNCFFADLSCVAQLLVYMMECPTCKEKLLDIFVEVVTEYAKTKDESVKECIMGGLKMSFSSIYRGNPIPLYYDQYFELSKNPDYLESKHLIYEYFGSKPQKCSK